MLWWLAYAAICEMFAVKDGNWRHVFTTYRDMVAERQLREPSPLMRSSVVAMRTFLSKRRGNTTAFEELLSSRQSAEREAGRALAWASQRWAEVC